MRGTGGRAGHDGAFRSVVGAAAAALALLLTPIALGSDAAPIDPGPPPAELVTAVAEGYLEAWERGDLAAMRELVVAPPADFEAAVSRFTQALHVRAARFRAGPPELSGGTAAVPFTASLDLGGLGTWDYEGRLDLVFAAPEVIAVETQPMAEVAAAGPPPSAGRPPLPVMEATAPRWAVAWTPASVHPALGPGTAITRQRVVAPRARLVDVDDVALSGAEAPRLPALSAQVLGTVGALDEAGAAALGLWYEAGDVVGTSGLQAATEPQLFGRPSGAVELVDGGGQVLEVLEVFPGAAPEAVTTTFDADVQAAAEAALAGTSKPAALVAIDAPSGGVRAVATRPTTGFNRAFVGQYPPGSTFKVVTAAALLESGVAPDTTISCPATVAISGFRFSNAGGEALGDIPFATAFYRSCNTAFVQLADDLDSDALAASAERFGFNADLELPVPADAGSFPVPTSPVEQAAAAIGQGRVTATPLQMASVAAAVASGTWRSPHVLVEPQAPVERPLPEGAVATLQELMRRVVAEGTGTAAQLPGEPVAGKTGTAEYGGARPPRTHAWFLGFRGDVAFAVVVEDGGFGGEVAAPIARSFLSRLG